MKLALRFLVLTLAGIFAVHAAYAVYSFRRELRVFDEDTWRDHETLARALVPAFMRAWQHDGRAEALRVLSRINAQESHLRAAWLPPGSSQWPSSSMATTRRRLIQREVRTDGGPSRLVTYAPVHVDGKDGYLVLQESTARREAYVHQSLLHVTVKVLSVFLWTAVISVAFGLLLIARPVHALVRQVRRIGTGELGAHGGIQSNDELGELAREVDRMADQLKESQEQLSREASARLRALNQLRHADRLATVGMLASGIAHELGTPLNIVSGRAKMIHKDKSVPEMARNNASIVADQVERMTRIIRQLLGFARAEPTEKHSIDLRALTDRVLMLLRPMADKHSIQLRLHKSPDPLMIEADPSQIQQVLTNLVVNAIQAMDRPGAVTVELGSDNTSEVEEMPPYPHVSFRIEDEGRGMAPSVLTRVFEPFFTTKDVGDGTGLGLGVAYGIVKEHGGFIRVESVEGRGSTFMVYFPASPPGQVSDAPVPGAEHQVDYEASGDNRVPNC